MRTGKIINDHIAQYETRGDYYGNQVIKKLADDLDLNPTVLWRCQKFAQSFENIARGQQSLPANLTWSHYRELITVPDKETRLSLMRRAAKAEWSAIQLAQKIQQEVTKDPTAGQDPNPLNSYPREEYSIPTGWLRQTLSIKARMPTVSGLIWAFSFAMRCPGAPRDSRKVRC